LEAKKGARASNRAKEDAFEEWKRENGYRRGIGIESIGEGQFLILRERTSFGGREVVLCHSGKKKNQVVMLLSSSLGRGMGLARVIPFRSLAWYNSAGKKTGTAWWVQTGTCSQGDNCRSAVKSFQIFKHKDDRRHSGEGGLRHRATTRYGGFGRGGGMCEIKKGGF